MQIKITTPKNMKYYNCKYETIIEIPLEEYVATVVASEVGNAPLEAAKAQAVAVRTFAVGRGVLNGKAISDSASKAQAFRADRIGKYPRCIQAAKETAGQILNYEGKIISAVYSASNGGRIRSAQEQWGNFIPYLISKNDPYSKTKKSGHGVGLSQDGASVMANEGKSYKEILDFYYPGTKIVYDAQVVLHTLRAIVKKIMGEL